MGVFQMTLLAVVVFFVAEFALALGSALANDGVVCGRGGCGTVTFKPGCFIRPFAKGNDRMVYRQQK
jgi:hypothetical protein